MTVVQSGGASIPAVLLVLDEPVSVAVARALLYQRETRRDAAEIPENVDWITELPGFRGTSTCLYAALEANIPPPLTGEKLAGLALDSAKRPAGEKKLDGISYLAQQKRRGVSTPLMPSYEEALLARAGARDLDEAWRRARSTGIAT